MDSLIGYGSDDEVENDRYGSHHASVDHSGAPVSSRRRDDDTNYDDVNMDMSEDSQAESEPELPQAEPAPSTHNYRDDCKRSDERGRSVSSREAERERRRESQPRDRDRERSDRRESQPRDRDRDRERSDRRERRDDRYKSERDRVRVPEAGARRGLLGDRPDDKPAESKVPALMDLKPFGGEPPPGYERRSHDARDAVSPRFSERGRREERREHEREREQRPARRSEERRHKHTDRRDRSRSRSRGASTAYPPPSSHSSSSGSSERRPSPASDTQYRRPSPPSDTQYRRPSPPSDTQYRRHSPPSDTQYRPSSYKVNKKLEVMEKMGLQIKTPSGSMATAQQLRAAASEPHAARDSGPALPSYYNASAVNSTKILDQVNKRKLLWANKAKNEQEEAAKWSGTRFAQDNDGKQVSKFMRLMGIKDPAAVKPEPNKTVDPIKKQEELFQAMQAQYEVARATTHTMRGVGLGFQRGQF